MRLPVTTEFLGAERRKRGRTGSTNKVENRVDPLYFRQLSWYDADGPQPAPRDRSQSTLGAYCLNRKDGEIDYSANSLSELRDIEAHIDTRIYPKNYENLQRAIDRLRSQQPSENSAKPSPSRNAPKRNRLWPDVSTPDGVRTALRSGTIACTIICLATVALTIYALKVESILGIDAWAFGDSAVYALCAYGIHRGSRIAAIVGLAIHVLNRVLMYVEEGVTGGVVTLLLILMLLNGVRGAFAYQAKFRKADQE